MRSGLTAALARGQEVLAGGGSALDAAVEAVVVLEDTDAFNAGHGAVLRSDGSVALDAAVMDGLERAAGAVAHVRGLKNPARAARAVLTETPHVLLTGPDAEALLVGHGAEKAAPDWFVTDERRRQLATRPRPGRRPGSTTTARPWEPWSATRRGGWPPPRRPAA